MSADRYMLELFSQEARSHSAALRGALAGSSEFADAAKAAGGLKGIARMLGFTLLADVCAKLEGGFSKGGSEASNPEVAKIVAAVSDCAAADIEFIEEKINSHSPDFEKFLSLEFSETVAPESPRESVAVFEAADKIFPSIDAALLPLFTDEVQKQAAVIDSGLMELEKDFKSPEKIEPLMRASHSLKGAARVVGLDSIVELTHEMENCFAAAQESRIVLDGSAIDLFFECSDFIRTLSENGFSEIDKGPLAVLLKGLRDIEGGRAKPAHSARKPRTKAAGGKPSGGALDSSVRVSAKSLSTLMELAAESLIENRRVEAFREAFVSVKETNEHIIRQIEFVTSTLEGIQGTGAAMMRLDQIRKSMMRLSKKIRDNTDGLDDYARKNVVISGMLYNEVLRSRMRPFSDGLQGFPRMVRDLAKSSGKKIVLEISGKDVPVDRDVLEKLDAPITHILRNACDHGIEKAEERVRSGKPETGVVKLKARHSAGLLMVSVEDDGRGIDVPAVKAKIAERHLVAPEVLAEMSREEILEFLFLPGFTTKENVSEISGRGVGLDIVQSMLREVGGSISIASEEGRWTLFVMKLPVTRSVLKSLIVKIDSQPYAFALSKVYRTLKLDEAKIAEEDGKKYVCVDDKKAFLVSAAEALGFARVESPEDPCVVIITDKKNFYALEVEDLPSESELVVRPLHSNLGKVPGVAAASLTEEGFPILILDTDDIMKHVDKYFVRGENPDHSGKQASSAKRALVVDDSATVRETQKKALEKEGFVVDTAVDGADGWNSVRLCDYDIVITDMDMPRLSGVELVKKIRAGAQCADMPVMVVSYKDRAEDRQNAMDAGATDYMTKAAFQDGSFMKRVLELTKGRTCKKSGPSPEKA